MRNGVSSDAASSPLFTLYLFSVTEVYLKPDIYTVKGVSSRTIPEIVVILGTKICNVQSD
jgi:hypothetical protein